MEFESRGTGNFPHSETGRVLDEGASLAPPEPQGIQALHDTANPNISLNLTSEPIRIFERGRDTGEENSHTSFNPVVHILEAISPAYKAARQFTAVAKQFAAVMDDIVEGPKDKK